MANHGTDPRTRMALLTDRVQAMQAIWTQDEASYSGPFVNFDRIWSWPKPVQGPWPPVLVGGASPTVLDRVLAWGDGWFPQWHDRDLFERIAELEARADRPIEVQVLSVLGPAEGPRTARERGRAPRLVLAALRAVGRGRAQAGEVGGRDRRADRPLISYRF
nr:hypothetical protein GCM10020092_082850 [Actinoplanes digitatis]